MEQALHELERYISEAEDNGGPLTELCARMESLMARARACGALLPYSLPVELLHNILDQLPTVALARLDCTCQSAHGTHVPDTYRRRAVRAMGDGPFTSYDFFCEELKRESYESFCEELKRQITLSRPIAIPIPGMQLSGAPRASFAHHAWLLTVYCSDTGESVFEAFCVGKPDFTLTEAHQHALLAHYNEEDGTYDIVLSARVAVLDISKHESCILFDFGTAADNDYFIDFGLELGGANGLGEMLRPLFFTEELYRDRHGPNWDLHLEGLEPYSAQTRLIIRCHYHSGEEEAPSHWLPTLVALIFECAA